MDGIIGVAYAWTAGGCCYLGRFAGKITLDVCVLTVQGQWLDRSLGQVVWNRMRLMRGCTCGRGRWLLQQGRKLVSERDEEVLR
jgi:hypothetical protein